MRIAVSAAALCGVWLSSPHSCIGLAAPRGSRCSHDSNAGGCLRGRRLQFRLAGGHDCALRCHFQFLACRGPGSLHAWRLLRVLHLHESRRWWSRQEPPKPTAIGEDAMPAHAVGAGERDERRQTAEEVLRLEDQMRRASGMRPGSAAPRATRTRPETRRAACPAGSPLLLLLPPPSPAAGLSSGVCRASTSRP